MHQAIGVTVQPRARNRDSMPVSPVSTPMGRTTNAVGASVESSNPRRRSNASAPAFSSSINVEGSGMPWLAISAVKR